LSVVYRFMFYATVAGNSMSV